MIISSDQLSHDKRMTALAVIDARIDGSPEDTAFLVRSFLQDAEDEGMSYRQAAFMLMGGMADALTTLIRMIDEEDPHEVVGRLRQVFLEAQDAQ